MCVRERILSKFIACLNFYHLEYSDYCLHLYCYTHNILVDMFFGLLLVCDNIPTGWSPIPQPLKPLIAIWLSSDFSHLQPGVFHISLQTHKTQHTQSRGERKEEQTTSTDLG